MGVDIATESAPCERSRAPSLARRKLVSHLQDLKYSILDVSMATRWHDDYNAFNSGVKDLEMMLSRVIKLAFDSCSSLLGRMDLLEAFHKMAKRDFIMRTIERETVDLCQSLMHEMSKCAPNKPGQTQNHSPYLPKYAGQAMWALVSRATRALAVLRPTPTWAWQRGRAAKPSQCFVSHLTLHTYLQHPSAPSPFPVAFDAPHPAATPGVAPCVCSRCSSAWRSPWSASSSSSPACWERPRRGPSPTSRRTSRRSRSSTPRQVRGGDGVWATGPRPMG